MTIVDPKKANVELKEGRIEVRAQAVDGWQVTFESWPKGDYKALFHGLPGNACLAAHHGYCIKGRAKAVYAGREEIVEAGQAYVLQPGHTFVALEDFQSVEFTQLTPEYGQVGEVFLANFPAWAKKNVRAIA